ncbi:hypothetical protein [Sphingomonas sp. LaA6.9]|uniref:hypothetical protein n=1 Tax=Sphingomonas sp. LaA6.9 TaxID=2919914 RepID=UPI001F4F978A|nr:hypothetical protein [Sphingomonas sp. LaA6.9]MCJ8157956.1 hypothetical protein [Sphingomonas sp. LaA6.9]
MPLCVPRIVGPVSSWSATLLIEDALSGAKVDVREGGPAGRLVLSETAGGGRDRLPLLAGVSLTPGAQLFAFQHLGESSGWTQPSLAITVGSPPINYASLPPLWVRSRIFTCGRALWIQGAVPGAEVTVFDAGGPYGTGRAHEGVARLQFTQPLPASEVDISIRQQAPAGAPVPAGSPPVIIVPVKPLPVSGKGQLPSPIIGEPMPMGCDANVVIRNIVDGAEVTVVQVEDGIVEKSLFDLEALSFILQSRLNPDGGRLTVLQAVGDRCGVAESDATTVGFGPVQVPPVPIPHPPCGGSSFLHIDDLKPGADLSIDVGGTIYRAKAPTIGSSHSFELAPMAEDTPISVTQGTCGKVSGAGTTTVEGPTFVEPPRVADPLFKCARVVRLYSMTPGSLVRVIARGPSGERELAPFTWCPGSTIALEVSPYLVEGDDIYGEVVRCGGPPLRSIAPVRVDALPPPQPVWVVFAFATQWHVTVEALPGAFVRIFVRRDGIQEIGSGHVDPHSGQVPTTEPLREGESLYAVQYICGLESEPGPSFRVREGEKIFTLPAPKVRPVTSEPVGRDVTWLAGKLTCRVDGTYSFFAHCRNKAKKHVVDVDCQVDLALYMGLPFGTVVKVPLAADDDKDLNNKLYIQKGYLAENSKTRNDVYLPFRNPRYWHEVLEATVSFDWFLALTRFPEASADDPEDPDKDKKPPPASG